MLGKLIKHELRATAAPMLLLSLGVLGVSALTRLCMLLAEIWDFFALFASLAMTAYIIGAAAAYIFVFVMIVRRFYTNIYGAEGYLTLMLPVKRWKLLLAKLLAALLWMVVSAVVIFASVLILASYPDLLRQVWDGFGYFGDLFAYLMRGLGMPGWLLIVELVLVIVIGLFQSVLMLYASVSIGQLFRRHRFFGSVAGYLMIYAACQILMGLWTVMAGFTAEGIFETANPYTGALTGLGAFQLQVVAVTYIIILALITLACYLITHTVMKRAVNLQ